MKAVKHTIQACCGKSSIIFKIDQPLSKDHLTKLVSLGFNEAPHFTKAGLLYVDNSELIITGPLGSDRLQVKCKKSECNQVLKDFEELLAQLG
jgi:hypothetical protein